MQQKNAALTEALAQAKDELRSVERDRTSLEDEKRRLHTQLANSQRQITTSEASLEAANQVLKLLY
jgi:septal ring factor EnvC (AmiA/AmiB activator)